MKPILDWSSYRESGMGDAYADIPAEGGDFARAVAVCINGRHCEDTGKGVMCPSFRAREDDPSLSTGGRVRLLKKVLNKSGAELCEDEKLARAMDLCVACKGCKRECDNEVDMAMIKVEYLAQKYRDQEPPLRSRLLAALPGLIQRWSLLKYAVAWRNRSPWLRALLERRLGLSAERELPVPVRPQPFLRPAAGQRETHFPATGAAIGEVTLLLDSFSRHFAPDNARAAIDVLTAAGYSVWLPLLAESNESLCCGRTALAQGLAAEARDKAAAMVAALLPHARAGRQIIGLEPACLLALRDDYRFLGLGGEAAEVADQALLLEEFIAREQQAGRFTLQFGPLSAADQPLLVHGHCHQKAVGAMKSLRKVLRMIPQLEFEFIESSCCGMAGSFGIEAEHAQLSMEMAELSLLPGIRKHPEARVMANGFSCRHQIREGAGRDSVHLAVLLREALVQ